MMYIANMPARANDLQMIGAAGRLKTAMKRRGYNARMLANATGISMSTLYHFENGRREMHLDDMRLIAHELGVTASWLAWGEN